ncbi:MAG: helix-turn-helix domain-containing protein [Bacteroidales bacterium]|nr:helix-turn-helix domain-containing protein [Bacteroidales bacterium]
MGKRFAVSVIETDKPQEVQPQSDGEPLDKALDCRRGRPKGAKGRSSKADQLKATVLELHNQGLSISEIAHRLGISRNTASRALHLSVAPFPSDFHLTMDFIRHQLKLSQSIVYANGGNCSRFSDAFLLLDRLEQRM